METTFQAVIYLLILAVLVVSSLNLYFIAEISKTHKRMMNEFRGIADMLSEINDFVEDNETSVNKLFIHIDDHFLNLNKEEEKPTQPTIKPNNWDSLKDTLRKPRMRSHFDE
jgi:hypothetical protein